MKAENRGLRRDMKKMIKQYTRLAERKKEGGAEEGLCHFTGFEINSSKWQINFAT